MVTNYLARAEGASEENFGLLTSWDIEIMQKISKFIQSAEQRQKPKIASNAWAWKCFISECTLGKKMGKCCVRPCLARAEGARNKNSGFWHLSYWNCANRHWSSLHMLNNAKKTNRSVKRTASQMLQFCARPPIKGWETVSRAINLGLLTFRDNEIVQKGIKTHSERWTTPKTKHSVKRTGSRMLCLCARPQLKDQKVLRERRRRERKNLGFLTFSGMEMVQKDT